MKNVNLHSRFSKMLVLVLVAAMVLSFAACGDSGTSSQGSTETKSFTFVVVDSEGNEESFDIVTDKRTVGEALIDEGLIEGEAGDYGLFVKVVNGITADYDVDGSYWAFYANGQYASSGVDTTEIEDGAVYSFKVEK